jgi:phage gpG-like protein
MEPVFSISTTSAQLKQRLMKLEKLTGELGERKLIIGSNRDYMRKHQLGIGVRKREFLGVNAQDEKVILSILDDAIINPDEGSAILALKEIGEYMLLATDLRFETETDPSGVPWAKNTPYTIRQKRALGRIQKVLQSTGIGRATITYQII